MEKPVVVKFGGSSLANSEQFKKVKKIVESDKRRRFVVPSAPGKSYPDDTKVTDLLYILEDLFNLEQDYSKVLANIKAVYNGIAKGIGIEIDLDPYFDDILNELGKGASKEYIASRGEFLNGILLSKYLGFEFIDPKEIIFFDVKGNFDSDITYTIGKKRLEGVENAVIPGFYGSLPNGKVKTFSRGGSDLTGSIISRLVGASLYENWTDVSGFLIADPRIVSKPKGISKISYRELRELSYMGASILHDEAIFPVISKGIPINIKNTNAPEDEGTFIVDEASLGNDSTWVTGIAGRKNFTVIYIEKVKLNQDKSFHRKLMSILESYDIYLEHMPSSIDSISLIIDDNVEEPKVKDIIDDIKLICKPDSVGYTKNISLITVVGHGMKNTSGTSATLFTGLARAGINVKLIVQGSSEVNIIVGISDDDYEKAIRAVYETFLGDKEK
ncbi:aspartate kinase [Miniphocaeibacter massiliensis]|uniref:aspartate kinase n=1 Tax=Miniphocaeibacter massiliensis TaxID=2041841 RepID=UPI000C1BE752|nr:aspartate kinase [Miniphocaeibacter massiliensis]